MPSTPTQFLLGDTFLELKAEGLLVRQRNSAVGLEMEVPYEEILPVRTQQQPARQIKSFVIYILSLLAASTYPWHAWVSTGQTKHLIMWGLLLALSALNTWLRYDTLWPACTLHTARLTLRLGRRPWRFRAFREFAVALELRATDYLRQEYAQINPLGPIDYQLHRLRWLHHLDVLTAAELQTLSTRLTGRVSLDPLKLMGQELETPYVN
ncbi:hypothetical protein [Hymenobacter mucosus]|uniref:Uncharacterized protein n=1 Tax=Hymenobacter mucosus TaxID=1411120 RepID=A0A239B0M8_9BACT|nr:hypothetical protein [Hymenobacter mucosus]SNS01161.1 hypothetical protein SAMN06269173_1172 [Hymenobacter mucosus]